MFALGTDTDLGVWTHPEWLGLLSRMLSVERMLSTATRQGLRDSLRSFVTAREKKAMKAWWRPEYVRKIVLSELAHVRDMT